MKIQLNTPHAGVRVDSFGFELSRQIHDQSGFSLHRDVEEADDESSLGLGPPLGQGVVTLDFEFLEQDL